MIYKMELSDSVDTMVFDLLEVPIVDKDITGIAENTTIDGNVYEDYLWLKKQYVQKWSIMCQDEYDRLRGFWTRQFGNAEVPFYRLFYGSNIYEDRNFLTSDGFTQILNPTERLAPTSLTHLYGNATQETLSGKNLVNVLPQAYTNAGISWTITDSTITGSGTTTGATSFLAPDWTPFPSTLPIGTYTFSIPQAISCDIDLVTRNSNNQQLNTAIIPAGQTSITVNQPREMVDFKLALVYMTTGQSVSINIPNKIQFESGSTKTDFEQYCGGLPSPNPNYPQDVNVVSGVQTVKITGKNLWGIESEFDKTNNGVSYKTMPDGTIEMSGTATAASYSMVASESLANGNYAVLNAGTYTISQEGIPNTDVRVYVYDADINTNISQYISTDRTSTQFTLDKPTKVFCRIRVGQGGVSDSTVKVMLVKGSTAEPFEPYQSQSQTINLGALELAKIGNYQDYIWNDEGTWYIHKEVGKITLDGSESGWAKSYGGTPNFFYRYREIADYAGATNTSNVWLSDKMSPANIASSSTVFGGMILGSESSYHDVRIRYGTEMTIADWQAYLATNPITIYYASTTPTDTEITDSELIEQLNHIYELYQRTNNLWLLPSAGAQGEIEGTYRLIFDEETDIVPKTPVVLTLTDGGVINPCGCRQNIQLIMRETEGN